MPVYDWPLALRHEGGSLLLSEHLRHLALQPVANLFQRFERHILLAQLHAMQG